MQGGKPEKIWSLLQEILYFLPNYAQKMAYPQKNLV